MSLKIALILGSTREGRFCDTIANWAEHQLRKHNDLQVDRIDPLRLDIPSRLERQCSSALSDLKARIEQADAFVIVTPEYNHGYPAPLKHLIDSVYGGWIAKPVGFVAYGGMAGGTHAVAQLKQVFNEVHAVGMRNAVHFSEAWRQFDTNGQLLAPELHEQSMHMMLAQLRWWANALKLARNESSYAEIAT